MPLASRVHWVKFWSLSPVGLHVFSQLCLHFPSIQFSCPFLPLFFCPNTGQDISLLTNDIGEPTRDQTNMGTSAFGQELCSLVCFKCPWQWEQDISLVNELAFWNPIPMVRCLAQL